MYHINFLTEVVSGGQKAVVSTFGLKVNTSWIWVRPGHGKNASRVLAGLEEVLMSRCLLLLELAPTGEGSLSEICG